MTKIVNLSTGATAEGNPGDELRTIAQTQGLGIPFGCENGLCGTCLVQIKSGMENLADKTEMEEFTLEARMANDDMRLCCQSKIVGDGTIELEQ